MWDEMQRTWAREPAFFCLLIDVYWTVKSDTALLSTVLPFLP